MTAPMTDTSYPSALGAAILALRYSGGNEECALAAYLAYHRATFSATSLHAITEAMHVAKAHYRMWCAEKMEGLR